MREKTIIATVFIFGAVGLVGLLNRAVAQSKAGSSLPMVGTTTSIGGSLLTAGVCASANVTVTGARVGMPVVAAPLADPGTSVAFPAIVSSNDTVTVRVCGLLAVTPTATTYSVRVIP